MAAVPTGGVAVAAGGGAAGGGAEAPKAAEEEKPAEEEEEEDEVNHPIPSIHDHHAHYRTWASHCSTDPLPVPLDVVLPVGGHVN